MMQLIIDFIKIYGINIFLIIILFFWGKFFLKKIVKKTIKKILKDENKEKLILERRVKTIGSIIIKIGNVVIYIIIFLMILNLFGVNIGPILAGTGIIGLAVSFGAQSLVKDFISGLFILIENQYAIGDKIKIDDKEGEVIKITMRSTILRNEKGSIFYVPNGSIKTVENFSQKI
ncbi:MAG: mechanosensitive ion channel domain-containing protein [bacterium]